jgi:predicted  nucleic acid-binding Zn-ribbon protein
VGAAAVSNDKSYENKRMQYLQDAIDTRTYWLDAAKERIEMLEKKCEWLERELRAMGKSVDQHEADIQKLTGRAP